MDLRAAYLLLAFVISSCALFVPTASVHITGVPLDYSLSSSDTTKEILSISSNMSAQFRLNGSNTVPLKPGDEDLIAEGVHAGWYYFDIVGAETWVRNVPVYLTGADSISFVVAHNYLDINGRTFFNSYQEKSVRYPFYPVISLNCYGCNYQPAIKFDGSDMVLTPPWTTVAPGWHTIDIYSPLDHVQLHYRTLFDNYTITQFDLYPVSMF